MGFNRPGDRGQLLLPCRSPSHWGRNAETKTVVETATAGQGFKLDLCQLGIPNDVHIVSIKITPQDGVTLLDPKQSISTHKVIPHRLDFEVKASPGGPRQGRIGFMVTWYRPRPSSIENDYLFAAAQEFTIATKRDNWWKIAPEWERVLIPANTALEIAVGRLVLAALTKLGLKESERLGYATRLETLLPLVAKGARSDAAPEPSTRLCQEAPKTTQPRRAHGNHTLEARPEGSGQVALGALRAALRGSVPPAGGPLLDASPFAGDHWHSSAEQRRARRIPCSRLAILLQFVELRPQLPSGARSRT